MSGPTAKDQSAEETTAVPSPKAATTEQGCRGRGGSVEGAAMTSEGMGGCGPPIAEGIRNSTHFDKSEKKESEVIVGQLLDEVGAGSRGGAISVGPAAANPSTMVMGGEEQEKLKVPGSFALDTHDRTVSYEDRIGLGIAPDEYHRTSKHPSHQDSVLPQAPSRNNSNTSKSNTSTLPFTPDRNKDGIGTSSQNESITGVPGLPDASIDSALLSALCDPRERFGLLRLEQTLIDFMKERTTGYIEVGGPNNSIVVGGQSGGVAGTGIGRSVDEGGNGSEAGSSGAGQGPVVIRSPLPQQAPGERGGRQTSFQRLCLHRLADRFNIVRESASNTVDGGDGYGSNAGGSNANCVYPPGLIRLVKVKNSRIPPNLLIDLDVSVNAATARQENGQGSHRHFHQSRSFQGPSGEGSIPVEDGLRGITQSLSETNLTDGTRTLTGTGGERIHPRQPPKKMKIMKRSVSGSGSSGNLKDGRGSGSRGKGREGGGRNGLKGKKLTDKEKAYAEARARIFNDPMAGGGGEDEDGGSERQPVRTESKDGICPGPGQAIADSSWNNEASPSTTPPPAASGSVSSPSSPPTSETGTANSIEEAPSSVQLPQDQSQDAEATPRIRGGSNSTSSGNLPAAAAGGGVSKVTWRNRRQEESDPDFRRRATLRVSAASHPPAVVVGSMPPHMAQAAHYGAPVGIVPLQTVGSCNIATYSEGGGVATSPAAPMTTTVGSVAGGQTNHQYHHDPYGVMPQQVAMAPVCIGKGATVYHHQPHYQQQYYSHTNTTLSSSMAGQSQQQYGGSPRGGSGHHHQTPSYIRNHQQEHVQAQSQAAAAAYYAQQHAAAYYNQAPQHGQPRSHTHSVTGTNRGHHPMQHRGSGVFSTGRGFGHYDNGQGRFPGGRGKPTLDGSNHGHESSNRSGGSATKQRGAAGVSAETANVHSMEEFPALR